MKKIAIISSTPRKNGNSEILAEEFARGARESGNEVKRFDVRDIDLKFCRGCLACQKTSACVIDDGMNEICDEISGADVLVFATPVYYYSVSGQLKTFLDRLNPLFARENRFILPIGLSMLFGFAICFLLLSLTARKQYQFKENIRYIEENITLDSLEVILGTKPANWEQDEDKLIIIYEKNQWRGFLRGGTIVRSVKVTLIDEKVVKVTTKNLDVPVW